VIMKRTVSWQVRFADRAVFVTVGFGSRPDRHLVRLVNARLTAVRRA
jgi:hypothetical protein